MEQIIHEVFEMPGLPQMTYINMEDHAPTKQSISWPSLLSVVNKTSKETLTPPLEAGGLYPPQDLRSPFSKQGLYHLTWNYPSSCFTSNCEPLQWIHQRFWFDEANRTSPKSRDETLRSPNQTGADIWLRPEIMYNTCLNRTMTDATQAKSTMNWEENRFGLLQRIGIKFQLWLYRGCVALFMIWTQTS